MVADSSSEVMEHRGAVGDAVPEDVAGMRGSGTRLKGANGQITGPHVYPHEETMGCLGFGFEPLASPSWCPGVTGRGWTC